MNIALTERWGVPTSAATTHRKRERLGNGVARQTVTSPDGTKAIQPSRDRLSGPDGGKRAELHLRH